MKQCYAMFLFNQIDKKKSYLQNFINCSQQLIIFT
jgi:hypothetical protein